MDYTTILVHLDGGRRLYQRLHLATQLARDFQTSLIGLLAVGEPDPNSIRHLADSERYIAARREWQERVAQQARRAFMGATDEELIHTQWKAPECATGATVQGEAHLADLVILGQRDPSDETACAERGFVESIVLQCGRPVLVVPYAGWFSHVGTKVLVAWNGSGEAARATCDALPLLRRAKTVDVVTVTRPDAPPAAASSPPQYAVDWLASHGVVSHTHSIVEGKGENAGERLLSEAASMEVDLIVMGAYSHGRIRETLLGGVTHTILTSMTVPVLMSH